MILVPLPVRVESNVRPLVNGDGRVLVTRPPGACPLMVLDDEISAEVTNPLGLTMGTSGTGGALVAVLTGDQVTSYVVGAPGSGYYYPPSAIVDPPAGARATASCAVPIPFPITDRGPVGTVTLLTGGSGYTTPPAVWVNQANPFLPQPPWNSGSGCVITATVSAGAVVSLSLDNGGADYWCPPVAAPDVYIEPPPDANQAGGVPTSDIISGALLGAAATIPGATYAAPPSVQLIPSIDPRGQPVHGYPYPYGPFTGKVTLSGTAWPATYSIVAGALPSGLAINPATGEISGTPTVDVDHYFTVRAELTDWPGGRTCAVEREYHFLQPAGEPA